MCEGPTCSAVDIIELEERMQARGGMVFWKSDDEVYSYRSLMRRLALFDPEESGSEVAHKLVLHRWEWGATLGGARLVNCTQWTITAPFPNDECKQSLFSMTIQRLQLMCNWFCVLTDWIICPSNLLTMAITLSRRSFLRFISGAPSLIFNFFCSSSTRCISCIVSSLIFFPYCLIRQTF